MMDPPLAVPLLGGLYEMETGFVVVVEEEEEVEGKVRGVGLDESSVLMRRAVVESSREAEECEDKRR